MVSVTQQGDDILFTVLGLHKLWAFKSSLTIPRAHIAGARRDAAAAREFNIAYRALGTSVPGLIRAGTFYFDHGLKPAFMDVVHPEQAVVIDLSDEDYQQLIIEVDDPVAVVALLATSA